MGKFKNILSNFVLLISIFTFGIIKVEAATGSVIISSNKSQVVVGNTVTFTVTVNAPTKEKLGSYQYNLSYDSSLLSLTSGDSSGAPVFTGSETKKTYTFKFKAKKAGTATVKFNISNGYTWNEEKISFSSKSKSVKIITQAQLEASYSKNNNLSSLGVEGYTLSPSFSSSITSYTVNLPANTESINITGKKADSSASIEGLGRKTVVDGTNTIKITVTAENGATKTYTITAIVEELNPIHVTINENEYTIIRKAKLLTNPNSDFIEKTTIINDEEVPTLYNEKANITLVGLKNQEGNIELYIYDETSNTYIKYNQFTFPELTLYIKDKKLENYSQKTELTIDEKTINVYTIENDSYYYFYAVNLTTGEESIYRYDNKEKTVQRYIPKEKVIVEEKEEEKPLIEEKTYQYIIIGLIGFIFLTYIIILLNLIFKGSKKKKKTPIELSNNEQSEKEELSIKEITTELKNIVNEMNENEIEKEKLLKETEEELTRINNSSPTETNEAEQTIKEVLEEKNTKKGNKNKKKKKTKKDKDI